MAGKVPGERGNQWSFPLSVGVGSPWGGPPRLQFVKLSPTAKAPARATEGAIGYDLYTPFSFTLYPRELKLVYTDIAIGGPGRTLWESCPKIWADP